MEKAPRSKDLGGFFWAAEGMTCRLSVTVRQSHLDDNDRYGSVRGLMRPPAVRQEFVDAAGWLGR